MMKKIVTLIPNKTIGRAKALDLLRESGVTRGIIVHEESKTEHFHVIVECDENVELKNWPGSIKQHIISEIQAEKIAGYGKELSIALQAAHNKEGTFPPQHNHRQFHLEKQEL